MNIPGFIELTLKVTDGKHRRTSAQISMISDFFETESGFTMICLGESNTFIVNESYDDVKALISNRQSRLDPPMRDTTTELPI
jgi:hypothetical protein